jgi:acetyl-CoA carboxylase biotin carboxyl carrier protein
MDLTNEDVADILALLDSLPYDELDLQTPRFRLTLRRTPDGWTQAAETRVAPSVMEVTSGSVLPALPGLADLSAATAMEHRGRYSSTNAPSVLSGGGDEWAAGEAGGVSGEGGERGDGGGPSGEADDGTDAGRGGGEVDAGLVAVRAPLPGTFYRAPRPGAAPFVEVGSRVGADTVVGIVETMKLFNSVAAGVAGTVAEICLANADFAARGATLLRIRAD